MLTKIAGMIRGLSAANYPENDEEKQVILNNRGDQCVVQALPELAELVRLGDSWQVALATGLAALTALPTTVAGLSLTNNDAATGKCLVIDSFGSWEGVIDATQSDNTAIFACLNRRGGAVPSGGTVLTPSTACVSLSGRAAYDGAGLVRSGGTVVNDGWFAHGGLAANVAPAVAGANWKINEVAARGLYIVPPGATFNVQAVKAAAAAAAQQFFFIRFHAVQLIWKT